MKKLMCLIIIILSTVNITCLSSNASTAFVQMTNGDSSLTGFGSVSEELTNSDINVFDYQLGTSENKALTMAHNDQNLYIYIYNKNSYKEYDRVSLSYYSGNPSDRPSLSSNNLNWFERELKLVSFDKTEMLQKYLIKELPVNSDEYFSVHIREIYNYDNRSKDAFFFSVGFVYQYNPKTNESKVDTEDVIKVTDKKVAYEVYPQAVNNIDSIKQRSYVAFSTDLKMDKLLEVKLKFDGFDYSAYTNLELNTYSNTWDLKMAIQDFARVLTNKNVYKHIDHNRFFKKGTIYKDKEVSVKNETINLTYTNGVWWSKTTGSWSYDTIEDTKVLKERNASLSDVSILNYDYIVTFDNRSVDCSTFVTSHYKVVWNEIKTVGGVMVGMLSKDGKDMIGQIVWNPFETPTLTKDTITNKLITDNTKITDNRMLEVENLTLLEFHYEDNGELKHALAVDTYNDTVGGSQFNDNTLVYDNFMTALTDFFSNMFTNIKNYFANFTWLFYIVIGIVALIVAYFLFSLLSMMGGVFGTIFTALVKVISMIISIIFLPFTIIKNIIWGKKQ